jgi:hypothetical protein
VRIDPRIQSLILAGESPEADLRFERAFRLNGARESNQLVVAVPPSASEPTVASVVTLAGSQFVGPADTVRNDVPRSSRLAAQLESPWQRLYGMVTQGQSSPSKGYNLDVFA